MHPARDRSVVMSMAPGSSPPPDHWRQAVTVFPAPVTGTVLHLHASHDDDDLWFAGAVGAVGDSYTAPTGAGGGAGVGVGGGSGGAAATATSSSTPSRPLCTCGVHQAIEPYRLAQLNSTHYAAQHAAAVKALRDMHATGAAGSAWRVLVVGDSPALATAAARAAGAGDAVTWMPCTDDGSFHKLCK